MKKTQKEVARCHWATSELNIPYHDDEWGVPVHDEHKWFEFLILEGAQAGLSWDTILKKRARYREVFAGFDPEKVARYDKKKVRELLGDAGIPFRGLNDLLCFDASHRHGQRSSGELFSAQRFETFELTARRLVSFRLARYAESELLASAPSLVNFRRERPQIRFVVHRGLLCEGLIVSRRYYRIYAHGR